MENSIREFGFTNPVLIDDKNELIAGHARLEAATNLGMEEIPAIIIRGLSKDQQRALVIADNKLAENAGWDNAILAEELAELGLDMALLAGFSEDEFAKMVPDQEESDEDDEVPELEEIPITQPGQLWHLGEHRVLVGDSTKLKDVKTVCEGKLVQLVWTDPPYNVDYEGSDGQKIKNDKMTDKAFETFLGKAMAAMFTCTEPGAPIYVAHADASVQIFKKALIDAGYHLHQTLIWVKNTFALTRTDYNYQHEPILYGYKPGKSHSWYGAFDKATIQDDQHKLDDMSAEELLKYTKWLKGQIASSIIREAKPLNNKEHPTMKPVALIIRMMRNSSKRGDTVLDPFGGSGSTLIAADKLGRRARLVEFDPKYVDVIIRRWQNYTGEEATLEGGKTRFRDLESEIKD